MEHVTQKQRDEVVAHFKYKGILIDEQPYGSGHINDTFLVVCGKEDARRRYILQISADL